MLYKGYKLLPDVRQKTNGGEVIKYKYKQFYKCGHCTWSV